MLAAAALVLGCSGPSSKEPPDRGSAASAPGLIAAYAFSEGGGTTTADASGNAISGTLSGATWATGKNGSALSFNGTTAYVNLGSSAALAPTGSITVSAWVNESGNVVDDGIVIARSNGSGGWELKSSPDTGARTFAFGVYNPSGAYVGRYSKTVRALGSWYHVAGVYDAAGQALHVYVNGVLDDGALRGSVPASISVAPVSASIGKRTGGFNIKGAIDDVRAYGRALSQAEVQTDMSTAVGGVSSPDTVAPSAPSSLVATVVSSSRIDLAWTAATDNTGVAGYRIFRNGAASATSTVASFSDVGVSASTTYAYAVSAFDAAGNESGQSAAVSTTTPAPSAADTIAPTVSLSAPANGATVTGTAVAVSANALDDAGVAGVQFLLDGASLGAENTASPWSVTWNTTTASSGVHILSARARDVAGNVGIAANVTVIVDNQPPTGSVVINGDAAATRSTAATLTLSAADALGTVTQMRFSNTGTSFSTAEAYATTRAWTLSTGAGTKIVYAQFKDAAGNWSGSFTDTIVLDTTAPLISAVSVSNVTISAVNISWTTDEPATSRVEYGTSNLYGNLTPIASSLVTAHTVTVGGLQPQTTYNFRVRSRDAAGNERLGSNGTFTTASLVDTTPPSVPTGVATRALSSSQIAVTWAASTDNLAVAGYRVFRDGVQIATAPGTSWSDAGLAVATSYTYAVAAFDPAGNVSAQSAAAIGTTLPVISVSPSTSVVPLGGTQGLACVVSLEGADTSCSWTVAEGPAGGSIDATGPGTAVYSAPATTGTFHVVATSNADSSQATAVLTVTQSATPTLVQHMASSTNPIGISGNAGNAFRFNLPNPVGAGNCLVLGISYGYSPTRTVAIADDRGNAWSVSPAATVTDRGNLISSIFVLPNAHPGPTQVTVTFDADLYNFQYALSEFYNVDGASPLNGISASSTTSTINGTGTLSSGAFTPGTNNDAAGGNLIWTYFASNSDGSTHTVTNWTAGPGFKSLHSDIGWHDQGMPTASEYFVQTAQGPINPGISVTSTGSDSYNAVSVALKASWAGTAPSSDGIRIVRQNISSLGNFTGVTNWTVQFPSAGNLIVLTTPQSSVMPTTSITDSAGNTWVKYAPDSEDPQIWYVANAVADPNLKITFHMSRAPTGAQSALMYDIVGADPNPVDAQAETLNATVTGAHLADSPVITPGSLNGLTIAAITLGQGPISQLDAGAPPGAVFDYVSYSNEIDTDLMDNADGRAHLYNSDLTQEHWNWLLVGPTANNNYASVALHFRAAPPAP
ncbi:MAG TPA: LamG-like jellyroll fold domain-containing protein [Myxococcales bacterium]|nr:LamG-like jellyroll fold domain-containing protein [Myxococcales bacterium]